MKKFYLHDGINQKGPFDIEELKSQGILKESPIWYEGLQNWTTADKVTDLNDLFKSTTPPPFAAKPATSPPIQTYNKPKTGASIGIKLLILTGTIVLILIGVYVYSQVQNQQYENTRQSKINDEEDKKAMIRNNITSYITAERSDYQYRLLGGILNLKISVNNTTNYLIDNVKVRVIYIKADGGVWDSRVIDFNLLNPNTKYTIGVPDSDRGTSVKYEIVSIKSSALGLY